MPDNNKTDINLVFYDSINKEIFDHFIELSVTDLFNLLHVLSSIIKHKIMSSNNDPD